MCAEQRVVEIPKAASVSATRRGETRVHLGPSIHVFLHSSPACRSLPNDDLWRGPEPQIPQNAKNCFPCSRESSRPGEARRAVESDSSVLRCRTGVPATRSIPSLTHAQTTASRPEATAAYGTRLTAPSHSLKAAMACRARKTVLWLVCRDPSRSLLGASRITCPTPWRGETSELNSSTIRLFPAVGRWGSDSTSVLSCPQRRLSPTKKPIGAKRKTLMEGAAANECVSFFAKKKGAPRGLHMLFFWNTRNAIIIAKVMPGTAVPTT